jgi:hypothetical protein
MSIVEVLKIVGQGGFPVLFALMLMGLAWIAAKLGPQVLGAWTGLIAAINDLKTAMVTSVSDLKTTIVTELSSKIAAQSAKIDSMERTLEAMRKNAADTAEDIAVLATGKHQASSGEDPERVIPKPGTYNVSDRDRRR